jgi:hypothetical protein
VKPQPQLRGDVPIRLAAGTQRISPVSDIVAATPETILGHARRLAFPAFPATPAAAEFVAAFVLANISDS